MTPDCGPADPHPGLDVSCLSLALRGVAKQQTTVENRCWKGVSKFQVMLENCRKISRYAGQEFHLMPESSA
jgi:hypothetical protein